MVWLAGTLGHTPGLCKPSMLMSIQSFVALNLLPVSVCITKSFHCGMLETLKDHVSKAKMICSKFERGYSKIPPPTEHTSYVSTM